MYLEHQRGLKHDTRLDINEHQAEKHLVVIDINCTYKLYLEHQAEKHQ